MRFIRGHNAKGMDRSGPQKTDRYEIVDTGYASPCWIWKLKTNATGYGYLSDRGRDRLAHRWYYEAARGPIPKGLQLDHLCRQRLCVNPDHLEPVTAMENGRRGASTKLSYEQTVEIAERRRAGETVRALGAEFGVTRETVRLIGLSGPDRPRRSG
jgi:hypothetical protein